MRRPHMVRADGVLIHPGDNGGPAWGTYSGRRERPGKSHPFPGQLIDVRRLRYRVSVTAQPRTEILDRDPYDVRPVCLAEAAAGKADHACETQARHCTNRNL